MSKHQTYIFQMTFLACIAAATLTSCNTSLEQSAETLENAEANLEDTNLTLTIEDSTEYANYKIESEKKLMENQLLIADMKDKMVTDRKESPEKYERKLDSLDKQNSQLRNNMQLYNAQSRVKWELFKIDFNRKLDALGKSIAQMTEWNGKKRS